MNAPAHRTSDPLRASATGSPAPILCFSHLRWDFVTQRPQHLMRRFAQGRRVFFVEEVIPTDHHLAYLEFHAFEGTEVVAVRPRIPCFWTADHRDRALAGLLDQLVGLTPGTRPVLWFYTPMMFPAAAHIDAAAVVYDCMDELSAFDFAPREILEREAALLRRADVVFTGGASLYEAKRGQHDNIHAFPSGVEIHHFAAARQKLPEPGDQARIAGPKLGFYGVIDERLDLELIAAVAAARPDWSLVMIGPVAKIDPAHLPRAANIHYLGQKDYAELPAHVAHWDVALMPFALTAATRFISPTKTPEYLAAGRPVVSTGITDVRRGYGDLPGVVIAGTVAEFVAGCETALAFAGDAGWLRGVDARLAASSWDETSQRMEALVEAAVTRGRSEAVVTRLARPAIRGAGGHPYDYLIVGAGLSGSVLAERLAAGSGKRVLICDRRPHVAGNTYDHHDAAGILVHKYGPHIFHTNSADVFDYLSRFTRWRSYEHRVLASVGDKLLPMPINRTTLNGLYDLDLGNEAEAAAFLARQAEPPAVIRNARDMVVAQVGEHLYRTFFEGYTRKQWGLDPSDLDKSVTARVPARFTTDDRYFLDTYQAMPAEGYTHMVEAMLDHPNIDVRTGVDYEELRAGTVAKATIFTGPIDAFFGYRFGELPYRSLEFRHETLDQRRFQSVGVVNFPSQDVAYTRITEYKHLTGQVHPRTSISYEFARDEGDPYYPVPRPENQALYLRYVELARTRPDVIFAGRLGTYKYYNMDQVVGQALAIHRRLMAAAEASGGVARDAS